MKSSSHSPQLEEARAQQWRPNIAKTNKQKRTEGEMKSYPEKQKLKEFITTRLALQGMLKLVFQAEVKRH